MSDRNQIDGVDLGEPRIVHYPDSRLGEKCAPVEKIDESLRNLVDRMFAIMFEARGVGLAAPQVGVTMRFFVASPSFELSDLHVYINPEIVSQQGSQEGEEGCLSLPGIIGKIKRTDVVTIRATDLDGNTFEETAEGLTARIFQHEMDHIDGRLIIDRMGSVAKLANRKTLKELEEDFSQTKS